MDNFHLINAGYYDDYQGDDCRKVAGDRDGMCDDLLIIVNHAWDGPKGHKRKNAEKNSTVAIVVCG